MEQKNYWNLVSNTKEFTTSFQTDIFCSYVNKDSVILDIGCGYGRTLNELYSLGYKHLTFTTMNGHTSNGFYFFGKNLIESTGKSNV